MANDSPAEIIWRQALLPEGVLSVQRLVMPAKETLAISPNMVMESYLEDVRRASFHIVQPRRTRQGIGLFLLFLPIAVIRFSPTRETSKSIVLPIEGGLLVGKGGEGELSFRVETIEDRHEVEIRLERFQPAILGIQRYFFRKLLYRYTQALVHRFVTVRFLKRLCHRLQGKNYSLSIRRESVPGDQQI